MKYTKHLPIGVLISDSNEYIFPFIANSLFLAGYKNIFKVKSSEFSNSNNRILILLLLFIDQLFSKFLTGSRVLSDLTYPECNPVISLDELLLKPFFKGEAVHSIVVINSTQCNVDKMKKIGIDNVYTLFVGFVSKNKNLRTGVIECLNHHNTAILRLERSKSLYQHDLIEEMNVQVHLASITHTQANLLASLQLFFASALKQSITSANTNNLKLINLENPTSELINLKSVINHTLRLTYAAFDRFVQRFQWFLAVMPRHNKSNLLELQQLRPIIPPSDRFWADPFLVTHNGRDWIFFEEAPFKSHKGSGVGHICVAPIDSNGFTGPILMALDLPWHLSYPNVFEYDGNWYMIPESGSQKRIDLFICEKWPDKWKHHSTLLDNYEGYDASILKTGASYWMFVARRALGSSTADFLDLFQADSPLGPWKVHHASPVVMDVRCARPGGRLVEINGHVYRPCQDSSGGIYGRGLRLQRILHIDDKIYSEQTQVFVEPNQAEGILGIHSFAITSDIIVVDLCRKITRYGLNSMIKHTLPAKLAYATNEFKL